ncbi:FeoA family protein [Methylophilus sp. 5]|uniref:FeoA family protein n=1 Tax=Methylophilus sp. 5 TaxID=1112274 RepID=UPI00048C9A65|nr:FeoA family protein [Methylophilus sp. 5]
MSMHLDALKPGQTAIIDSIHAEQALSQRLGALGFRSGKQLEIIRQAAFNGPLHVRIGSTDVIIRLQDAKAIQVRLLSNQTESLTA